METGFYVSEPSVVLIRSSKRAYINAWHRVLNFLCNRLFCEFESRSFLLQIFQNSLTQNATKNKTLHIYVQNPIAFVNNTVTQCTSKLSKPSVKSSEK